MYKKILVASMGEYLDEIVKHTLNIVEDNNVEIIGIYVVEDSSSFFTSEKIKKIMIDELTKKGTELLDNMAKKLDKSNITFKKLLIKGDPAKEIVKTAEDENIDLIILGSGKSKIDKHLLGSVSEKVVHSSETDILLIKNKL